MSTHTSEEAIMKHEMHFRALLIKIQDSLSDSDRCRLHFLFGNIIPRRLREDSSISGTLNLLESLCDRGLINDQDFDYLIQAFQEIHCGDIVKSLNAHARELRKEKGGLQPTLLQQVIDDIEEDKILSAGIRKAEMQLKLDPNTNNIYTQHSSGNVLKSIDGKNDVVDRLSELNSREMLTKWTHCRSLVVFNIIGIMAIIVLLIVTVIRVQQRPSNNPSNNNNSTLCNNKTTIPANPVILAYFISWWTDDRKYFVSDIPADKITHINYAFANIDMDGRIALGGTKTNMTTQLTDDKTDQSLPPNLKQLIKLKKNHPHLRTLISVGGDTYQERFKTIIVSNQSRSTFATSCIQFMEKYSFDGIDLDWRNPMSDSWPNHSGSQEDKQHNLFLLLKELRRQMNAVTDKKYLLTLATGVNPDHIVKMNLSNTVAYVDWINVITYDFHDNIESKTSHNAPLYKNGNETLLDTSLSSYTTKLNCDAAIQAYIATGVPSNMILMGIPLYGRGWQGVTSTALNGFLQSASSTPPIGTWGDGSFDYYHLKKDLIPSYERYWDDQSKVPFLFNKSTGIWISYDDLESIKWKTDYIKEKRLGGAFFWELSKDRRAELIGATFNALTEGIDSSSMDPCFFSRPSPSSSSSKDEVDHQVIYEGKIYRCIQSHKSILNKTSIFEDSLWQLQSVPT